MISNTTGDRRWGTARRSGMTILGKVAVPKPINLPSQRLENQGLDPNVEIVPKGTLSWGTKSSLNAWGSSSLSPRTENSAGSPSYLSNRPSSGGTGTRPSTAGSDKAHESSANAWNSNSRPSSASGMLPSNQASLAPSRPRSAETRPGSSPLSRFAETAPENSAVWGQHEAEKLGAGPTKNDGFSLVSGDFPSLGTEKASTGKSAEPQDHGPHVRPGSSSGRSAVAEERSINSIEDANVRGGKVNTWRRDHQPCGEEGPRHGLEERQMDPPGPRPYTNANFLSPHHFDGWRGPPINNHPGGVWYRGSPPPYRPPVGPGGFPMDPFSYYPQVSPAPGHGAGPRVNHPMNVDMYRPPMPDSYVRPGMPIRPGIYPGPVPYEGYYGPPMGYCNPNNRDMPFVGMPPGPYGYNKHSGQGGYDPAGRSLSSENFEPGHSQEIQGPYKVLLKPQEGRFGKDEAKREESLTNRAPDSEKVVKQRPSSNNDRKTEVRNERHMESRRILVSSEASSETWDGGSSETAKPKLPEQQVKFEACGDIQSSNEQNAAPGDPSLFQKIEGLNAKSRTTDGRQNASSGFSTDEQGRKSQTINSENSVNKIPTRNPRIIHVHDNKSRGSSERGGQAAVRNTEEAAMSRRSTLGTHSRADYQSEGRVINKDSDGWRKNAAIPVSSSAISATSTERFAKVHVGVSLNYDSNQKPGPVPLVKKNERESEISTDVGDSQRYRMRELAKQRALQRQKEEEERAKDQQEKARAKLEELNRRTQIVEDSGKSLEADYGATEDPGSLSTAVLPSRSNLVSGHVVQQSREAKTTIGGEICEGSTGETRTCAVPEVTISIEVSSAASSMTTESTYTKRKNNRNGKKKHKVEETTTENTSRHVTKETESGGKSIETGKDKAAETELPSDSIPSHMDSKELGDSAEKITSSVKEEAQGRAKSHWKSQHSRRSQRGSQGNKPAEKFQGTDAVIWAPVRTQPKADIPDEASYKAAAESVASASIGHQAQINSKSKRVELERYVPKPIANEMAGLNVSKKEVIAPAMPENAQKENSGSEGTETLHLYGSTAEKSGSEKSRHGNGRMNKQGRGHGSWRQRGPVESTNALENGHFVNRRTVNYHQHHQSDKSDVDFIREQPASHDDEWNDGWSMIPETQNSGTTALQSAVGKNEMTAQTLRGNKGGGSNYGDHKKSNTRDFNKGYVQQLGSNVCQSDSRGASKDNHGLGDRSASHWQPKTHAPVASNQGVGKNGSPESISAETDRTNKDMPSDEHQRFAGEQRTTPPDRHVQSQNQASTKKEVRVEQNSNSGFHKNKGQGRYYGRGHDSRGDWGSSVEDGSHHQRPQSSRDTQRQNTRYEYQPVGNVEKAKESSQTAGPRYRERGHGHQRHGGERFYQRQRGSDRIDTGYD